MSIIKPSLFFNNTTAELTANHKVEKARYNKSVNQTLKISS